jgi:hypothetical protein
MAGNTIPPAAGPSFDKKRHVPAKITFLLNKRRCFRNITLLSKKVGMLNSYVFGKEI